MSEHPDNPTGALFNAPPAHLDAKKKRALVIQSVVSLVFLVIIFGWLLPLVIDYQEIFDALGTLDGWKLMVLLVAGLAVALPEGWLLALLTPPLRLWQGSAAWMVSTGVGNTVPAINLVFRYGMYRSWGATAEDSMLGIFMSGVVDNIVKFSLPAIAVVIMVLLRFEGIPAVLIWVAVIGAVIVVGTVVVTVGIARSERFARWLGDASQRLTNATLRLVRRPEVSGFTERLIGIRDAASDTLGAVWKRAFLASALGKLWTYVILLIAMRFAAIPADVITAAQAFLVWTLVLLVAAIPITPGGLGFVEAAYIALFGAIAGPEYATEIGVCVVLYRAAQLALPIVVGWPTLGWWRWEVKRGRWPDPFQIRAADTAGN